MSCTEKKFARCIDCRIGESKASLDGIAGTVMPWHAAH
jgi:hypothetical protein